MLQETFKEIILDFHSETRPKLVPRTNSIPTIDNMSIAITGVRRCGKTYRTFQYIDSLIAQGISIKNICRVQFNDYRLRGLTLKELGEIEKGYYSLFPSKARGEIVYFVFDEIHRIEGWEDFILHLIDSPNRKVLITGSTSKLLTGEIASALRGKNFSVVQFPFSFGEFLTFHNAERDTASSTGKNTLRHLFQKFLIQGGFPGLLTLPEKLQIPLLQNYTETMVLRDIIEAHPHDNISINTFSDFYQALISRVGCPMTVHKVAENLKTKGLKFSNETLYKYLAYLKEAFLLYTVDFFSPSEKIRNANYKKVYSIDWALAQAIAPGSGIDITRRFENLVFIELLRQGYHVSYYRTKEGYEIDFVVRDATNEGGAISLIQVCYDLSDTEVRERELRALCKAARYLGSNRNIVITLDQEEHLMNGELAIEIIPAWKFCS